MRPGRARRRLSGGGCGRGPTHTMSPARRLPVGAEVVPDGGVQFRVWAPRRRRVEVVLEKGPGDLPRSGPLAVELAPEGNGYFSGKVTAAGAGTLYRYRLDGEPTLLPVPASR